ncbi:MAG TPA: long-chain fatty acid--CoA ligase [Chitinophagaceae bacterium]
MAARRPTRLFDILTYQQEEHPLPDALAYREESGWRQYSTAEVQAIADQLSIGLMELGISGGDGTEEQRDKVALISKNRPEWIITDLAVQQVGAVLVPVYPTIHESELGYILHHACVKAVFVNDKDDYRKLAPLQKDLPHLKAIYSFEREEGIDHWTDLLLPVPPDKKDALEARKAAIAPGDLATIVYTSGTTGVPKGVMLSHRNIIANVLSCYPLFEEIGIRGDKALSFLPLNHAFEKTATYLYLYTGVSVYYARSTATLVADLQEVKPVIFTTVPRLLEKVYEGILSKGEQLTGVKRKIFSWSLRLAERYEINKPLSPLYKMQRAIADRLVFSKWREALGGRVRSVITGAAACQVRLLRIFGAAGIVIQEGYGLTEAAPVISGNRYAEKHRMFGTVGPVLQGVEVKIAPDGEILCRGDNVMMGYYKRPDATAEVIKDGWLHTGDIGRMVDGQFLKITDRKKELFKTSGGKYVAPQPIENKMAESRFIEQLMVVGENQKFVSALIVPAFHLLKEWYEERGHHFPGKEAAVQDTEVMRLFRSIIDSYNKAFNPVEQVKKFGLLPSEWTIEGGELTPTLKPKRRVIAEKYRLVIQSIYA